MKVSCPNCGKVLMTPPGFTGGKVKCPGCQAKFMCDESGITYKMNGPDATSTNGLAVETSKRKTATSRKMTYAEMRRSIVAKHLSEEDETREKANSDDSLCFWLGLLFSVFGLVIAAIICKGQGVRKALKGFLISFVIWVLIVLIF